MIEDRMSKQRITMTIGHMKEIPQHASKLKILAFVYGYLYKRWSPEVILILRCFSFAFVFNKRTVQNKVVDVI